MSDQLASSGTTTNGKQPVNPDSSPGVDQTSQPLNGKSVEERLDALKRTIRDWDWRSAGLAAHADSVDEPKAETAAPHTAAAQPSGPEDLGPAAGPRPSVRPTADDLDAVVLTSAPPRHAKAEPFPPGQPFGAPPPTPNPLSPEPQTRPDPDSPPKADLPAPGVGTIASFGGNGETVATEDLRLAQPDVAPREAPVPQPPQPRATLPDPVPPSQADLLAAGLVTSPLEGPGNIATQTLPVSPNALEGQSTEVFPFPAAEPRAARLKSKRRSRVRILLLCVAALVVVLLIIGGIQHFSSNSQNSGSGTTTPTVATGPTVHAIHPFPLTSAQLVQYKQYAGSLDNANTVVTHGLAGVGSAPTVAELEPVTSAYVTALNNYNIELAFIKWPTTMQAEVKADQSELALMAGYLKDVSVVSPEQMGAWLAQLNSRAGQVQSTDNVVRQELGLPKNTSFP